MRERTLLVVMSVLLLLAVGTLLYGVAPMLYDLARHLPRKRRRPRTILDPRWGTLTSDGEFWSGVAGRNGRDIHFHVAGDGDAPDPRLLAQLENVVGRFKALERRALEFLQDRESELRGVSLDFYGLDLIDENRPDDFTFEFLAHGDDSVIWRVDFVAGEPKYTGMDD